MNRYIPPSELDELSAAAREAWKASEHKYGVLQVSKTRYSVIGLQHLSTGGTGERGFVTHAVYAVVEGYERLSWGDARQAVMELRRREQGTEEPSELS
jgi:hypothetical protein